jgi:hypothetical protein
MTAGFDQISRSWGCGFGGFSSGVHFISGVASINVGTRNFGFTGWVLGKILVGLVCGDDQKQHDPVRVGIAFLVAGNLKVGSASTPLAFLIEPSSVGVCGQPQSGAILPEGTGFDASDGLSYNLIDTGGGRCSF